MPLNIFVSGFVAIFGMAMFFISFYGSGMQVNADVIAFGAVGLAGTLWWAAARIRLDNAERRARLGKQ